MTKSHAKYIEFVVGVSKYGTIYTATVSRTNYCSVSFTESSPFVYEDEVISGAYADRVAEFCDNLRYSDPEGYISQLEHYDCPPADLMDNMLEWEYWEQFYDLTGDYAEFDGDEFQFECISCGQLDPREGLETEINPVINQMIFDYWDSFHLKTCTEESEILWNRLCSAANGTFYGEDLKKALGILYNN